MVLVRWSFPACDVQKVVVRRFLLEGSPLSGHLFTALCLYETQLTTGPCVSFAVKQLVAPLNVILMWIWCEAAWKCPFWAERFDCEMLRSYL